MQNYTIITIVAIVGEDGGGEPTTNILNRDNELLSFPRLAKTKRGVELLDSLLYLFTLLYASII